MRLKENPGSYRASGIRVRDARHVHNGPSVPKHRSGKDTKRWCFGKVGREHEYRCFAQNIGTGAGEIRYYALCCSHCGKEKARWWPNLWPGRNPKPDWVTEAA